jgi:putative CocE/NonD family hydrolase
MTMPRLKVVRMLPVLIAWALAGLSCDPETGIITDVIVSDSVPVTQIRTQSFYLPMSDGVRIAVDVMLPRPSRTDDRMPAIVEMTRGWRAEMGGELSQAIIDAVVRRYAYVILDERGTGASYGTWPHPWSARALADFEEVVDWILEQYWSNGRVGATGDLSAQLLAARGHPAVRAAVSTFSEYDLYTDILFPGGIFSEGTISVWSAFAQSLDQNEFPGEPNRHVKRVDEDRNGAMLAEAVAEHAANGDIYDALRQVTYRDEMSSLGVTADDLSVHSRRDALEASNTAIYSWASWMDHATAHAAITRFRTLDNPQEVAIGAWPNGGWGNADPLGEDSVPPSPILNTQWREVLNYMDRYLKPEGAGGSDKILYYYTMGAGEWKSTAVWPVQGTTVEPWYLDAGNLLAPAAPTASDGSDLYTVDFTATTGDSTRWHTAVAGAVRYPERAGEDQKLLTYTSAPLEEDLEITGYPVVTLYVRSTHADGAFFAYLEDVDASGRVTYLTEGQLRALHRSISPENPPYELLLPYHSFEAKDGEPMTPGAVAELTFGMYPTSVLLRAGHRIRVAIAGADAGLFARVPESGDPVITVERNAVYASKIELPIVR